MGAWGYGSLESDGAQDTLAGICDELFSRIIQLLQHPRAHEHDDIEFDELFVRIEMIFALHDHGMINTSPNPESWNLCSRHTSSDGQNTGVVRPASNRLPSGEM